MKDKKRKRKHPKAGMESALSLHYSQQSTQRAKDVRGRPKGAVKDPHGVKMRIQMLTNNIVPIPFVPPKKGLDLAKYEKQLKDLGLWDFAHVEFDACLRTDLIVKLVANYHKPHKLSYFDSCRVEVTKTNLARALKLPCNKKGRPMIKAGKGGCDQTCYPAEFPVFMKEFAVNWMLLSKGVLCVPRNAVKWYNLIDNGQPEMVDWPALMWCMVENELDQGAKLRNCFYASHLQLLIKDQKPELLYEASNGGPSELMISEFRGGECAEEWNVEQLTGPEFVEDGNGSQENFDVLLGEDNVVGENVTLRLGWNDVVVPGENVCDDRKRVRFSEQEEDMVTDACSVETISLLDDDVDVTMLGFELPLTGGEPQEDLELIFDSVGVIENIGFTGLPMETNGQTTLSRDVDILEGTNEVKNVGNSPCVETEILEISDEVEDGKNTLSGDTEILETSDEAEDEESTMSGDTEIWESSAEVVVPNGKLLALAVIDEEAGNHQDNMIQQHLDQIAKQDCLIQEDQIAKQDSLIKELRLKLEQQQAELDCLKTELFCKNSEIEGLTRAMKKPRRQIPDTDKPAPLYWLEEYRNLLDDSDSKLEAIYNRLAHAKEKAALLKEELKPVR